MLKKRGYFDDDEGEENGDKTSGSSQIDSIIQRLETNKCSGGGICQKKSAYDSAKQRYEQLKAKLMEWKKA